MSERFGLLGVRQEFKDRLRKNLYNLHPLSFGRRKEPFLCPNTDRKFVFTPGFSIQRILALNYMRAGSRVQFHTYKEYPTWGEIGLTNIYLKKIECNHGTKREIVQQDHENFFIESIQAH